METIILLENYGEYKKDDVLKAKSISYPKSKTANVKITLENGNILSIPQGKFKVLKENETAKDNKNTTDNKPSTDTKTQENKEVKEAATNVSTLPPTNLAIDKIKAPKVITILSGVGLLGGLFYAYKSKRKFWGYVGFGLLGSIAGGTLGNIVYQITKKK